MSESEKAVITLNGKSFDFPVVGGTEGNKAVDISTLRSRTGYITLDEGLANTGSCKSSITYIDGEKGKLSYRGIPIEVIAANSTFIETAYLIIYGNLPTRKEMSNFSQKVLRNASLHEGMMHFFDGGFPFTAHPMAILSSLLNSVGCYYPYMVTNQREQDLEHFDDAAALLLSKVRTIAAMAYRMKNGLPLIYPKRDLGYSQNFLHMMFNTPCEIKPISPVLAKAVDKIKEQIAIPLIADIHFNYKLALMCAERGIDALRINPGNIGERKNVEMVVDAAKARGAVIRVGVNSGSVEKRLLDQYGGPTPQAMVESALGHVRILEEHGFYDTKISIKSSSVLNTIECYRLLSQRCDYPLHLGVTEAGGVLR